MSIVPLWRWRTFTIWLIIGAFVGLVGQLAPLLHTLGYEYSLVISLISSVGAGHLAACYPERVRNQLVRFPGARAPALVLFVRVLGIGLSLLALPLALSLLNGLRIPICNLWEGLAFFLVIPLPAVILATAIGLCFGLITNGSKSASLLWFLAYFVFLAVALRSLYTTPAVFSFGPFFGYYPGVLYDRIIPLENRLLTYRVGTLLQTAALVSLAHVTLEPAALKLRVPRGKTRHWRIAVCAALVVASFSMYLAGPSLGHRTSRTDLEHLLSRSVKRDKLSLFFPPNTQAQLVDKLTREAEFGLQQIERYLGTSSGPPITVFFFASASEKAAAMGAAHTNVAKPWRSEVYVILETPPHTILRHELAHAVAARFGRPPFGVAARLGGFLPNPGLIEGIAVAAQGPRGDLTIHQWAAAMSKLDLLPPLESLFGLGFFDLQTSAAYTAAGSFVSWIQKTFGAKALQTAYRTTDWKKATKLSLDTLENKWLDFLKTVALDSSALAIAKHRFDHPPVIRATCVHEVARLTAEANRLKEAGMYDEAIGAMNEAVNRSGGATDVRLKLFYTMANSQNVQKAVSVGNDLLNDASVGSVAKATIREILADLELAEGNRRDIDKTYADLAFRADNRASQRRLQVKAHLAQISERDTASQLLKILSRSQGQNSPSAPLVALIVANAARKLPRDPIVIYLMARQYFIHGGYDDALQYLTSAEQLGLRQSTSAIWQEARMMRGKAYYELQQFSAARAVFDGLMRDRSVNPGLAAHAKDWSERCSYELFRQKDQQVQ